MSLSASISLVAETPELSAGLDSLSRQLGLPVRIAGEGEGKFHLVRTRERLELRQAGPKAPGAVYVDFVEGKSAHRRKYGGGRGQPLARAIGLKKGVTPSVLDATAGMGKDAFVLATLGCRVTLVERSPIVAALLEDGLRRARDDHGTAEIAGRMTLVQGDAADYLAALEESRRPQVIYMDPMYPHRDKSALVKKEMRLFQEIVGPDTDSARLLQAARECAVARVVVKRPAKAGFVGDEKPGFSIESPNTRYDVYVNRALSDA
ncbi:MAG: class I SAM-dependent methyltransferase [Sedimenticola sp.]